MENISTIKIKEIAEMRYKLYKYAHTHAFELVLELSHVIAVGEAEVVVRIISLRDAVGGSGSADGEHGGRTLGPLRLSDFVYRGHIIII